MGQEIQKATAGPLTFQKQPTEFLRRLRDYMKTMQLVHRTQLAEAEMSIWVETLKGYSYQEFDRAMTHLISNRPKYQLDDGSIQVWTGMPKLPDVIDVMLDQREEAAISARKREQERRNQEFKELEQRRAEHPEEFFGWADVVKALEEKKPELTGKLKSSSPSVPAKEWPQAPPELNEQQTEQRRQQMKREFEQHQAEKLRTK